ncbi:hypothetical protein P8C59_007454 [Phyllachora maydis]|uniref:Uncharacterized protein n=1 Tax=Phyllachora maydis TaxID=1825666 RepID=A0AAD9MIA2_9PEZI|nr:hypothetical protein P8C59_007454 [Phyllachora maydis]
MEGRIMAAYGLSGVVSPFVLSAPVLLKVLRKDRWLVYRGKEPAPPDEFSRGYSCAFHRLYGGERIRHPVNEAATTTSSPHDFGEMSSDEDDTSEEYGEENGEKAPNMGLVFAAYRLPRADGTTLESDRAEINALKEDAEALVMTLFDLYADDVQRRKYIERTPAYF